MKTVYFLGAGFSVPFGLPTMNEFLPFADSCSRLDQPADREFLGGLLLDSRRANSFLESSPFNIEDILSFAIMADRLGLTGDKPHGPRVIEILRRVYTSVQNKVAYWSDLSKCKHLFNQKLDYSVITTNYDLNIECALLSARRGRCNPGGLIFKETPRHQPSDFMYDAHGLPIYKLHGSVNWYLPEERDYDQSEIEVDNGIIQGVEADGAGHHLEYKVPFVCLQNVHAPREAIIIPPSFLKPELVPAMRKVWQGAAKELETASRAVFIGYSFPPSDTEMMYFLARAFAENQGLRSIHIVDPRADEIEKNLTGPESRYGSHFKRFLRIHPHGWEEMCKCKPSLHENV